MTVPAVAGSGAVGHAGPLLAATAVTAAVPADRPASAAVGPAVVLRLAEPPAPLVPVVGIRQIVAEGPLSRQGSMEPATVRVEKPLAARAGRPGRVPDGPAPGAEACGADAAVAEGGTAALLPRALRVAQPVRHLVAKAVSAVGPPQNGTPLSEAAVVGAIRHGLPHPDLPRQDGLPDAVPGTQTSREAS